MAQAPSPTRPAVFWLVALCYLVVGFGESLQAQEQPYLLLQGPSPRTTYRFPLGSTVEVKLAGEEDFFTARIVELFPESQAIRLDDLLLSFNKISEIRVRRKGSGFRRYLQIQGLVNLGIIGLVTAFDRDTRTVPERRNFAVGAAVVNAVMVVVGSIDHYAERSVREGSPYVLKVAGGDIRQTDDPDRGMVIPPSPSRRTARCPTCP